MDRFLACSGHTGRQPPSCYVIEAPSAQAIEEKYPVFAGQPILKLPEERPAWMLDEHLAALERDVTRLGEEESRGLGVLLGHLEKGNTWRWYTLEEQPAGAETVSHGELGTFGELQPGSDIGGLPHQPGSWRVVALEPPPHPGVAATLVIESSPPG